MIVGNLKGIFKQHIDQKQADLHKQPVHSLRNSKQG
jgi:hypothetical protein